MSSDLIDKPAPSGPPPSVPAPGSIPLQVNESLYGLKTAPLHWLARWCRVSIAGLDHLPDGGAVLVSNHGCTAVDAALLIQAIYRNTGRLPRGMADRIFFRSEWGRWFLHIGGVVEASTRNARALLNAGQWVLNYPGGSREVMKDADQHYQLMWDGRTGFARLALELGVPVVPIAGIGVDDLFLTLMDQREVRDSRVGAWIERFTGPQHVPPLWMGLGPLPLPGPVHFMVGEPMHFPGGHRAASDQAAVAEVHSAVRDTLRVMLEDGLEARRRAGH